MGHYYTVRKGDLRTVSLFERSLFTTSLTHTLLFANKPIFSPFPSQSSLFFGRLPSLVSHKVVGSVLGTWEEEEMGVVGGPVVQDRYDEGVVEGWTGEERWRRRET